MKVFLWRESQEAEGHFIPPLLPSSGESVPTEEQFDKEKVKAEAQAMDNVPNNDKAPAPSPAQISSALPGAPPLTGAEKQKYDGEIEKLYKELDDKVL